VRGNKISKVHTFINNHFSGALKNSVLYERAVYSARMDGLTNVLNRRSMEEHLLNAFKLAKKYRHPLSLCLFDIDHFKRFNDTYGHQTGDMILKELAALVSAVVREVDIVARYGGEEFCIIFPHTDKEHAFEISERIRVEVEAYVFPTGKRVTISMGVASYPEDDAAGPQELLKKADIALYRSKITRNAVTAYRQDGET
jgi:diguanylate cyclase (GGDEF)-like protein